VDVAAGGGLDGAAVFHGCQMARVTAAAIAAPPSANPSACETGRVVGGIAATVVGAAVATGVAAGVNLGAGTEADATAAGCAAGGNAAKDAVLGCDSVFSANARSGADWNRDAGSFSRQRSTMRRSAGAMGRSMVDGIGAGASRRIALIMSIAVAPPKAGRPLSIS